MTAQLVDQMSTTPDDATMPDAVALRLSEGLGAGSEARNCMSTKDTPLIVERVANGYQVRPMFGPGDAVCVREIMVFQDKGYVSAARDGQRTDATLLGWLDTHFTDAEQKSA